MKTMHRNSTLGLAIGSVLTAAFALALTALTDTGAGGAYAFLFLGVFIFMVFLIWPERSRPFRGRGRHAPKKRRVHARHEPR
jgi:drug/metabolite transporter superfamily protein YnfA